MQLLEGVLGLLAVLLYILVLAALSLGIFLFLTAAVGVVGSTLSVPVLYLLPDVRRFLVVASGGRPDDDTPPWRIAFRLRYLLLSTTFGVGYGVVFLLLFVPIREAGLTLATVGPVPVLVAVPLAFVLFALPLAYAAHRHSTAWMEGMSERAVLVQWAVFLAVVVGVGTAVPIVWNLR